MSSQLVPRSNYVTTSLSRGGSSDAQDIAERSATIAELAKVANHEVAQVGAHTIGTMAQLVKGSHDVTRLLETTSHSSPLFDDCRDKVLQVTGSNLITLANAAQQEIMRKASGYMR